jgi:hypothetical protein
METHKIATVGLGIQRPPNIGIQWLSRPLQLYGTRSNLISNDNAG